MKQPDLEPKQNNKAVIAIAVGLGALLVTGAGAVAYVEHELKQISFNDVDPLHLDDGVSPSSLRHHVSVSPITIPISPFGPNEQASVTKMFS